ncbi:MAG TPA: hydroxymethylglutaryl-CoA lyase [Phycisphaerae bacterium]|nr:hydroxymethylglutaryl-CoA lyase [Phycisphaerae bacterium]
MPELPPRVKIVEVGPRDGLQNESEQIPTATKISFIQSLVDAGLTDIEVTSFVNPKKVPQLADAADVARALPAAPGVVFSALVPNAKGLERAVEMGIRRIAVFTAASDAFTAKNIGMTVDESLENFEPVVCGALGAGMSVRGYVSTAFVCPYAGEIAKERVREVTQRLLAMGCDEVAISDTIGAAAPTDVIRTVGFVLDRVAASMLALHFHDTYGTALANVYAGLQLGISTFDSSAGGLGGCPYAVGASGNLATEDLVYFLDRMHVATGVTLDKVAAASNVIAEALGRDLPGKQWKRLRIYAGLRD